MKKETSGTTILVNATVYFAGLLLAYLVTKMWFGQKIAFTLVGGWLAINWILNSLKNSGKFK